ncbi:outer membrane lipoprotein carrier protein LolA [Agromyces sp. GXQ0307]|uniref:LolA family protein n=1 Tax=Agromyces sp. GXQ0307 TaxID=3377835 RepID=UPI00383A7D5D
MSPRRTGPSRSRARTVVPAVGVPVAIAVAVLVPMQANATVDLPDLTAEELVAFAKASEVDALSGTIEQRSELGLPDLGALMGGGPGSGSRGAEGGGDSAASDTLSDLLTLATGSFDANVYLDGEHARLQVLDRMAERNLYLGPGEAWFVDSESQTATRLSVADDADVEALEAELERLADEAKAEADAERPDGEQLPTPQQLLDRALDRLDETTAVSVGTDGRVAGRDAYELVLEPRTDETLVGEIRVAVDGENGAALAASVTARGADTPAFEVGFTDVSFAAPDASVFAFEPSASYAVEEEELPLPTVEELRQWVAEAQAGEHAEPGAAAEVPPPVVHGEGWATVVELDAATAAEIMAERRAQAGSDGGDGVAPATEPPFTEGEALDLLDTLTTPVDGGRALQTSLLSVLFTDDGRVLAGSVPVDTLVGYAESGR